MYACICYRALQVRAIALDCVAHLMKSAEARRAAAGDALFLTTLRTALLVSLRIQGFLCTLWTS